MSKQSLLPTLLLGVAALILAGLQLGWTPSWAGWAMNDAADTQQPRCTGAGRAGPD